MCLCVCVYVQSTELDEVFFTVGFMLDGEEARMSALVEHEHVIVFIYALHSEYFVLLGRLIVHYLLLFLFTTKLPVWQLIRYNLR